jgi:septum formation protein
MLVLASASPRRQELLRNAGIEFTIQAPDIVEATRPAESPQVCAQRLAQEKAMAVALLRPNDQVLGADTIVVVDDQILGKPCDEKDAVRMLRLLSGRRHEVITGVCLAQPGEPINTQFETTIVEMGTITDEEIAEYVATGEPMDKAGAYAIQGVASRWILGIEGDYFNVVGLPVSRVYRMLQENQFV